MDSIDINEAFIDYNEKIANLILLKDELKKQIEKQNEKNRRTK